MGRVLWQLCMTGMFLVFSEGLIASAPAKEPKIEQAAPMETHYSIYTLQDMKNFRAAVEGGYETSADLMNDITLDEKDWTPIGSNSHPFKGIFDGHNYTIYGLKKKTGDYGGLFGKIEGATIRNLYISSPDFSYTGAYDSVASLQRATIVRILRTAM